MEPHVSRFFIGELASFDKTPSLRLDADIGDSWSEGVMKDMNMNNTSSSSSPYVVNNKRLSAASAARSADSGGRKEGSAESHGGGGGGPRKVGSSGYNTSNRTSFDY